MTFTAQREEKEKNLKNFANNFFMDIILKKKKEVENEFFVAKFIYH